jgi:hypothetical protein
MRTARSRGRLSKPVGRRAPASPQAELGERRVLWQVFDYRRPLVPARPRFTT